MIQGVGEGSVLEMRLTLKTAPRFLLSSKLKEQKVLKKLTVLSDGQNKLLIQIEKIPRKNLLVGVLFLPGHNLVLGVLGVEGLLVVLQSAASFNFDDSCSI